MGVGAEVETMEAWSLGNRLVFSLADVGLVTDLLSDFDCHLASLNLAFSTVK